MFAEFGAELNERLLKGEQFQEILEYPDELLSLKFQAAQDYYRQQLYDKSKTVFAYLALIKPSEKKYWMCLAASQVKLKLDKEALKSYSVAALLDPQDPTPHLFSVYCLLKENRISEVKETLRVALSLARKKPIYKSIEEKALRLKQGLG